MLTCSFYHHHGCYQLSLHYQVYHWYQVTSGDLLSDRSSGQIHVLWKHLFSHSWTNTHTQDAKNKPGFSLMDLVLGGEETESPQFTLVLSTVSLLWSETNIPHTENRTTVAKLFLLSVSFKKTLLFSRLSPSLMFLSAFDHMFMNSAST